MAEERRKKRFEIMVFENDLQDSGLIARKPKGKEVVEAYSRQELVQMYGMCDQSIEFLAEYDIPDGGDAQLPQAQQLGEVVDGAPSTPEPVKFMTLPKGAPNIPIQTLRQNQGTLARPQVQPRPPITFQRPPKPPKYYSVGGIDIKEDNGKIYQKQWMKLSDNEAANLRIVNDKTNKIVSIDGKHIEMKKWVLVEDKQETDDCSIDLEQAPERQPQLLNETIREEEQNG